MREALGSPHLDSRAYSGPDRDTLLALSRTELSAKVKDIDTADAILVLGTDPMHAMPILDLRVRKAIRRNGARLVVATERPTALDGGAEAIARYAPGEAGHFVGELAKAIGGEETVATPLAETLRDAGKVVVLWGQRIDHGSALASARLLELAQKLNVAATAGSGLLEIPDFTNARGLREAGVLPDAGPGLGETTAGYDVEQIRSALEAGDLTGLVLFGVDPLRDFPDTAAWETALTAADFVVSFSMHENATTAKSDVVLPLETHAEKDGTVTHPDGRLQRVRPAASRPEGVRSNIRVLSELSAALGQPTEITSQPAAFAALTSGVSFYNGITDEQLGGTGFRWQEGPSAGALPQPRPGGRHVSEARAALTDAAEGLLLGTYRDIWAGPVTELNPPLRFLLPKQRLELSEPDAERLRLKTGYEVRVSAGDASLDAIVQIKERVPEGVCFLSEGISGANANSLRNGGPVRVTVSQPETIEV